MNNDERIRRWRKERLPEVAAALGDDDLGDLPDMDAAAFERAEAGSAAASAPALQLAHEISIEEARAAIARRRREQWRRLVRNAALFVGVPLLAILSYVTLIATPLYQGEAVFTVQTSSDSGTAANAGLFGLGATSAAVSDALKAREFILSRPMMDYMEKHYGLMSHFASPAMDPLQRFKSPLGLNRDPLDYYRKRVRVAVDVQEGLLTLYVQARTPQDAERFGNAILAAAQRHVNEYSAKMSADQINALDRDVQNSARELADARRSLAVLQARRGDLNPEQTATAVYQLISNLELQLAEAKRERNSLLDQGLTNSPLLPRLNSRVEELQSQITEQRQRLASPGGTSMVRTVNEFENASSRKELAQTRYQTTLDTLQQAYLKILEQRRYFVTIVAFSVGSFPAVRDVATIAWPILLLLALIFAMSRLPRLQPLGRRRFAGYSIRNWVHRWR
jgi:capsular polysaccharide transport system permease protein